MSENQNVEVAEIKEEVKEELKVDSTLALNRYIFMREVNSYFVNNEEQSKNKMKLWSLTSYNIDNHIKKLTETDLLTPLNLIKKAVQSKSLYSSNEALWCLAYCLSQLKNDDLRKEIRKNFNELVTTSDQLLIFMHAFQLMKGGKMNFGRGMRSMLGKWYSDKTSDQLFDFLYSTRKYERISHKNIIYKLHLKIDDKEKNKVIQSIYKNQDTLEKDPEPTVLDKMIVKHRFLKSRRDTKEVVEILKAKEFSYKIHHIPPLSLKNQEVVDLILPNMTLTEVIDNLITFCSYKMLKVHEPISRKICNALQVNNKTINEAKLHPIHIFAIMKELEKRLTVHHHENPHKNENGNTAAAASDDKSLDKKVSNQYIIKKLFHIFNHTLNEQPKTGCRYFITVDFRHFSKRQSKVFGMRNVLCSELQAIVALTLLKNEKEVTVMSFSETNNKLKPVEWNSETSFEKALELYEKEIKENAKTKEIITLPLKKAIEDKKKVDVFITFVSSLGRCMGKNGKPDQIFAELQNYRKVMNLKMTKYVIINMTRKTPDMKYDEKNINNKGVLEIVGFSEKSAKVLEAYAKNCFA
ncbi:unnamed protein product [Chironomus riparius]|uniref:TROVE domain-containing protein n=1 Tax=Chironomus riparius TaxID=315576 RepID=A0A9N9WTF6_9DIPT|nr:unnamed protein product [Chironomus riparius]